jgi:AcrR family transcriptional regulator
LACSREKRDIVRNIHGRIDGGGITRRQEQSLERRRRTLAAANRCFSRTGFAKTSVALIAREAGVSKGLVFVFFKDKEFLYDEVIRQTLAEWARFAEQQGARFHDRPDLELANMFRGSFEFAAHSPMLRVLMARRDREIQQKGKSLPAVDRAWRERLTGVLRRGVREQVFRADLNCRLAASVIHNVQHFYLDQMLGVEFGTYDPAAMELALQLLTRALKNSAAYGNRRKSGLKSRSGKLQRSRRT